MSSPARAGRLALLLACVAIASSCRDSTTDGAEASSAEGDRMVQRGVRGTPVLFIGLDGADWGLLDRFVATGSMPNLARLIREGSSGTLLSEEPSLSPILWTTMLTGVSPLEHRILDFTRFDAAGRREPIGRGDRRAPAVWNIASDAGLTVGLFGLWATHPAEPLNGRVVSDRLSSFLGPRGAPPSGAVHPPELAAQAVATLRELEHEIDLARLRELLPDLTAAELERARGAADPYSDPVAGLLRLVVETALQDRLCRAALAAEKPDLTLLYLEATDAIGHLLAPRFAAGDGAVASGDAARYRAVPERFFAWIDRLLGDYAALARARGAVLFLASDHGFRWLADRPEGLSSTAHATAARWHRPEGIYLLHGPGIAAQPRASAPQALRRVAATVLALLDLPPGVGLAGPPLPPVVAANAPPVDYGARFRRALRPPPASAGGDATSPAGEELAKLRALGYLGAREAERGSAGGSDARTPGSYNHEGLLLRADGRTQAARAAFERALALAPGHAAAAANLSDLLWSEGEADRADELLLVALAHDLADGDARRRARLEARLRRGREALDGGECVTAEREFGRATAVDERSAPAFAALGLARLCLGDTDGAGAALRRSLALDPAQPALVEALARLGRR